MTGSVEFRLPDATNGTETLLEFVDPSLSIDKLGKASEEWMGIRGDTDRDQTVLHTVDDFLFLGSLGRTSDESLAGGHVNEDDRIVFRMKVLFHGNNVSDTLPTRRDAEDAEKLVTVKQASWKIFTLRDLY